MHINGNHVFICYSNQDAAALAKKTHFYLNRNGIKSFCDLVDDSSYALGNRIFDLIRDIPVFLFLASPKAVVSSLRDNSWINKELLCAKQSSRIIITVVVGPDLDVADIPRVGVMADLDPPKVTLSAGIADEPSLRSLLSAVPVLEKLQPEQELSNIAETSDGFADLIRGVCATIVDSHERRAIANAIMNGPLGCSGVSRSAREILEEARTADARVEAVLRRAVFVSLLRNIARRSKNSLPAPTDARSIWPMLLPTLDPSSGLEIYATRSAQGFCVVPLFSLIENGRIRQLLRLHIWDMPHKKSDEFSVHSHQPNARSWVLAGTLANSIYTIADVSDDSQVPPEQALFSIKWDHSRSYALHHKISRAYNTGQAVASTLICRAAYTAGETYGVPAGEFHDTTAISDASGSIGAASLFLFDAAEGWADNAGIVGPMHVDTSACRREVAIGAAELIKKLDCVISSG